VSSDEMNDEGKGRRRSLIVIIFAAVILLLMIILVFYWSNERVMFNVVANAKQTAPGQSQELVRGYVTTHTLITLAETLLDKPGGFLSNDVIPPGLFMDDMPSWEFGALVQVRDFSRAMRNNLSRAQTQSFYLDQRENRKIVQNISRDCEVLNAFAYTGSFGIAALHGGAKHVTNIESSAEANRLAREQIALNGVDDRCIKTVEQDVFKQLRYFRDARHQFDLIILDPPKFADSANQLERAARAYKDINLLAFKLLRSGGSLITFSCSGHMVPELFQKVIADAALDAMKHAVIVRRLEQAADHPVALNFPESQYFKGLVCQIE